MAGLTAASTILTTLPGKTDRFLRTVAGEGNDILFWFLRFLTVFAVGVTASMLVVGVVLVFGTLFGKNEATTRVRPERDQLEDSTIADARSSAGKRFRSTEDAFAGNTKEHDIVESCEIREGPGIEYPRKVNRTASDKLGEIQYLTVDSSVTVRVLKTEGEWAEIQVMQPDFLEATHRGWVPTTVIKDGTATRKMDGWIRTSCLVYPAPDASQSPIGYLSPPSTVSVADDGSGWLRLMYGPIKNKSTNEFLASPQFDAGLYIEKSTFTMQVPATW